MQFNIEINQATIMAMLVGFVLAMPLVAYAWRKAVLRTKVFFMQRLPLTIEKIDADKEVIRAHHVVELRRLELQIAETKAAEAEANAMASEAMGRIDKLNRRIEVLQLKLAARGVRKEIRKVDEQLIELDAHKTPLEEGSSSVAA